MVDDEIKKYERKIFKALNRTEEILKIRLQNERIIIDTIQNSK